MFQRRTAVAGVRGGIVDSRLDFGAEYGLVPHPNGTDAGGW
jgi:hypothetical protein